MGVYKDAIDLIRVQNTKTASRPVIRKYKADTHFSVHTLSVPKTYTFIGGGECSVNSVQVDGDKLILDVEFRTGKTVLPFSNPWVIINAPMTHEGIEDLDAVLKELARLMYLKVSA